MNQARKRTGTKKVLSMILVLVMLLSLLSMAAFTLPTAASSDGAASNDGFKRIVHIDCGRKYFRAADLKKIIDYAAENYYTDVELAFGNDGLRFLLDDMSLTANGTLYDSNKVTSAIQKGNKAFYDAGTNELTESEMTDIISYAREKGIGIIPMFDAPGHLQAVVKAMETLGMSPVYTTPTTSGTSVNYAIDTTDNASTSFVKALMQKYITYFKKQGCTMFNFAADECGFSEMTNTAYTSYAEFVNDLAAMVKNANMTPMAFNDGIYHLNLKTNTDFDTSIVVCYWDATDTKYAPAADLASRGFKILNTNNKWYYVIGIESGSWFGYQFAINNMKTYDCLTIDGNNKQTMPVGCMAAIWCDTPTKNVNWTNVQSYISTFSTSNPNYFKASATTPEKPGVQQSTENKTVSVTVGGTTTVPIDGKNLSADGQTYATENPDIATVTVSGQDEQPGNVTYTKESVNYRTLAGSNTSWTRTEYYYPVGENYYPVYAYFDYGSYRYYYGYSTTDSTNDVKRIDRSWNGGNSVTVYSKSVQATIPASTTLTFKGVAVGTTYVTIDNVKYTIQVAQEELEGKTLPMQLWFTTCDIEVDTNEYKGGQTSGDFVNGSWQDNKKPYYVSVAATDAYGENGVPLTSVLPETMYRYENSNTYWINEYTGKVKNELVLWSGRVHSSSDLQLISGKDYSNSGTEFQYVRYYAGNWAVSVDRTNWTNVTGEGSTASVSSCKEQLAVYYMMRSQITKEVSTDVADWGYVKTDTKYATQINLNQYVMLDFSVKYQDNTRNPSTFPQDGKTFLFHCTPNDNSGAVKQDSSGNYYRQLNNFRGMNTGDYEIYMVTVTMTDGSASNIIADTTSYAYDYANTEQIVWAIDEATKDKSGLDPYTSISGSSSDYSGCKIGGDPYVRGVEVYNQHGALITYYVRAKITTDALQVHYVNQTTGYEFYNYPIVVNSGTYFDTGFAYVSGSAQESGSLKGNKVTNSLGVEQTIESDLASIPEIGAQYRYGNYKFVDATRTDDKNVTLYYTFNTTKKFVVDFGLPLTIRPQDIAPQLANANLTKVVVGDSRYADITRDDNLNIIYKLNKAINGQDDITVTYYGTNAQGAENNATYTVSIIPATSVYYEDSFAQFTDGTGKAADAKWTTDTDGTAAKATTTQALSALGSKDVYGHDAAYADSTKLSMGSAHKVTVSKDMYVKGDTTTTWPTATFTFKGTGFDVISLTDNNSGMISVKVYAVGSDGTETLEKTKYVNNYYGYEFKDGVWTVNNSANNALYQIPVIKVDDLAYGTHKVVITTAYASYADKTGDNQYSFWLDAIRVYDPMGKDNATYTKDGEGYPQYIKLRDQLAKENGSVTTNDKLLFIDGAEKAEIATYANYGPNNEVYLANGQAITFTVPENANIASIQIGAKAPDGSAAQMVVTGGNGLNQELSTATEMYYQIGTAGDSFTITNTGTGILSLTNLKITFTDKPGSTIALTAPTADEQTAAVMSVRALFAAPEQTFEPEHFTAKWSRNVRKGGTATLTVKASADVEAITVNGEEITVYTTKTARNFWGAKETYHVFTYRETNAATADYTVCALNADGVASDPITATLTVRPSIRDWWNGIFDKWKH